MALKMGRLDKLLRHPDELYPLLKMKLAVRNIEKRIPVEPPHWRFCYTMLNKVSTSYAVLIQNLEDTNLRNVSCIVYLILRALDTVEDDTTIATEVKVPILRAFHRHIHDSEWHFSCGTKDHKVLMDKLHVVYTAFSELGRSYQEVIEDMVMRMGAGMAKFICKEEVETLDDYDEYCYYVSGIVVTGMSKIFHICGKEDLDPDDLSNTVGLFLQKASVIRDYLEDINEMPKPRRFWPRQIWSKYANKLEDLKYEENSVKALHCLNDMVTNALVHADGCLRYVSALKDPSIFHFSAITVALAMGQLALSYNNIEVFKGLVKMRRGLIAKIVDRSKTMAGVYGVFYDFCLVIKAKVDDSDPNAAKTKLQLDAIMKTCTDFQTLNQRKFNIIQSNSIGKAATMVFVTLFTVVAILLAYRSPTPLSS